MNPRIAYVLFSPDNGMLLYNPFIILIITGVIWGVVKKNGFAIYYFTLFAIMVYLSASWHQPNFGCGYGQRNFVDI